MPTKSSKTTKSAKPAKHNNPTDSVKTAKLTESTKTTKRKKLDRKTKIQISVIAIVFLAIVGYFIWDIATGGPLTTAFNNKEEVVAFVNSAGPLAPLLFILLQIFQTVAAPIPGNIAWGVGGFLFGWWGVLWTVIGSAIGCFIVFYLSRRFGRPLVEKLVDKESLDKFDFISGESAPIILFLIFLIPGLPDDVVCYIAGLTKVPIRQLMALVIIGRFPSIIVTNYIGAGLGEADMKPVIIAIVATVILLAIIAIKRNAIVDFLKKKSKSDKVDNALEKLKFKDADIEMQEISEHRIIHPEELKPKSGNKK